MPSQSAPAILIYHVQNMGCKKQGANNKVIVIQKKNRQLPYSLFNNNDPVFFPLLFAIHIFDLIFFQGHKPTHVFKTRTVGTD